MIAESVSAFQVLGLVSARERTGGRATDPFMLKVTIDAIVTATAALSDAVVVTGDPEDFKRLSSHFPGVAVLSA